MCWIASDTLCPRNDGGREHEFVGQGIDNKDNYCLRDSEFMQSAAKYPRFARTLNDRPRGESGADSE